MMHRPWSSIVEVPHCFSRSNVKFQGHTALKIVKFYRNWAFLDSNASLNSLMVMKCCTKLETAKERCPIVFQSHPSNFKVTRDKTSPLLTRIWRFRTIGRSQLSNPSDLPCSLYLRNDQKIWITTKIHIFTKGFKHIECGRFLSSVRFLRRPVGPRPATLLSGLQLQKGVGPVGRQLSNLLCWAEWSTTVNGHWRNKIVFKRYTFSCNPNQH